MAIDEEIEETAPVEEGSSKLRLYLLGAVASFLLLGLVGLVLFVRAEQKRQAELEALKNAPPPVVMIEDPDGVLSGAMLRLDSFVLNMGSTDEFLRVSLVFEYFEFELPEEINLHVPKLRDAVIQVLAGKSAEELLSVEGKSSLRLDLIDAANRALQSRNAIVDVYFTEFTLR